MGAIRGEAFVFYSVPDLEICMVEDFLLAGQRDGYQQVKCQQKRLHEVGFSNFPKDTISDPSC
jgi:hypothetical protein